MPCAVFSYGQCWLPGPAPLALYVNMTCEFEPAPTRSGEVGRGWDSVQARYAYTISYDLERTVYLGPPARDDDGGVDHVWLCLLYTSPSPRD